MLSLLVEPGLAQPCAHKLSFLHLELYHLWTGTLLTHPRIADIMRGAQEEGEEWSGTPTASW